MLLKIKKDATDLFEKEKGMVYQDGVRKHKAGNTFPSVLVILVFKTEFQKLDLHTKFSQL